MGMACSQMALCKCIFSAAPIPLNAAVPPTLTMGVTGPIASIMHNKPMMNILPMGTCKSPQQPSMKLGIPGPCIPLIATPWVPGAPTIMTSSGPLLNNLSIAICQMKGIVQILMPGSLTIITTP